MLWFSTPRIGPILFTLTFWNIGGFSQEMRKLGSYLIILLILTAYGRCVADQFGMLHTTNTSCCQVTCDEVSHCDSIEDTDSEHSEHQDNSDDEEKPNSPIPSSPCQLCLILSSDSMLVGDQLEIPSPIILDISPASTFWNFYSSSEAPTRSQLRFTTLDLPPSGHPDTPTEQRSRLQRIVAKTTPVRGPSTA